MKIKPDKKEFTQLIEQNKGIIFKVCNTYCRNKEDIDDLSQDIVYNLWRSFSSYNQHLKFTTWMYRIALNVAISFYRKEKTRRLRVENTERLIELQADEIAEENENFKLLFRFINTLKEIDRSIILLYLEDRTYREIASITGITETNVATRIARIKERLKSDFQTIQK
jgi:RNA polymerase sigma factor (sigma-70 family)